jgi:hypothetical protein
MFMKIKVVHWHLSYSWLASMANKKAPQIDLYPKKWTGKKDLNYNKLGSLHLKG